jgi:hypothetical protein
LAGAFFFAGFAAGLVADRPGLWALQVLHIFITSLPVLIILKLYQLIYFFAKMDGPRNAL